jgi:hypothetical protein
MKTKRYSPPLTLSIALDFITSHHIEVPLCGSLEGCDQSVHEMSALACALCKPYISYKRWRGTCLMSDDTYLATVCPLDDLAGPSNGGWGPGS